MFPSARKQMWCELDLKLGCESRLFQQTRKARRRMHQNSNSRLSGSFACNIQLALGITHMHNDVPMQTKAKRIEPRDFQLISEDRTWKGRPMHCVSYTRALTDSGEQVEDSWWVHRIEEAWVRRRPWADVVSWGCKEQPLYHVLPVRTRTSN